VKEQLESVLRQVLGNVTVENLRALTGGGKPHHVGVRRRN
jgi:hypothetical protein